MCWCSPVVPLAMLLSFIAGVVALLTPLPMVALVAGLPAYGVLSYIIAVAKGLAVLPLAQVIVPRFSFGLVMAAYALIAFLVVRMKGKTKKDPPASEITGGSLESEPALATLEPW